MSTNLINIKNELRKYHRDRKQLERYYVNERLSKSLESYYDELRYSVSYLNNRKPDSVFRRMED